MGSLERFKILNRRRKQLKRIRTYLIRNDCTVNTLKSLNNELDRVEKEIDNIMWW